MVVNNLSNTIIGYAIEEHKQLDPEILKYVYQECLYYELKQAGQKIKKEKPMSLIYKDIEPDHGYRTALLVEDKAVIEIKTIKALSDVHTT